MNKKIFPDKKTLSKKLPLTNDKALCLKDFAGEYLILYFYPKDDTPGCTLEGEDFTRLYKKFRAQKSQILGVSKDSLSSHEKFKAKYHFPFDLISDPEGFLCQAFDVLKQKNMYGKKIIGIERSTFVLDKTGRLIKEWRKVKAKGHAQEVLDFIKKSKKA